MQTTRSQWHLGRNCAMRPGSFALHLLAIATFSCGIGAFFWAAGYPLVAVFCLLQILAVLGSGLYFAIHAADGEHVALTSGALEVRVADGFSAQVYRFDPAWTRLESGGHDAGCFWLCSGRTRVRVGGQLTPARRGQAAREISSALKQQQPGANRHLSTFP